MIGVKPKAKVDGWITRYIHVHDIIMAQQRLKLKRVAQWILDSDTKITKHI